MPFKPTIHHLTEKLQCVITPVIVKPYIKHQDQYHPYPTVFEQHPFRVVTLYGQVTHTSTPESSSPKQIETSLFCDLIVPFSFNLLKDFGFLVCRYYWTSVLKWNIFPLSKTKYWISPPPRADIKRSKRYTPSSNCQEANVITARNIRQIE